MSVLSLSVILLNAVTCCTNMLGVILYVYLESTDNFASAVNINKKLVALQVLFFHFF